MKKATLILCISFLMPALLFAQDGKSFRLGLKVAPNLGWTSPVDKRLKSDGSLSGFNFGLMGDIRLGNDNYALSTGLFYMVRTGGKYVLAANDSTTVKSTMKLEYVQLPVAIKLKTNEIGYMTYFALIGADLAVNVGAKGDMVTSTGRTTVSVKDDDISDNVAMFRAALLVGAGVEYNFSGNTSALVGVNYSNGFTNVLHKDQGKARLHYLELALGLLF